MAFLVAFWGDDWKKNTHLAMQNFPWILGCSYKKWGFSYQEL
jgi:hypothetical protein